MSNGTGADAFLAQYERVKATLRGEKVMCRCGNPDCTVDERQALEQARTLGDWNQRSAESGYVSTLRVERDRAVDEVARLRSQNDLLWKALFTAREASSVVYAPDGGTPAPTTQNVPFEKAVADTYRGIKQDFAGKNGVDPSVREQVNSDIDKLIEKNDSK